MTACIIKYRKDTYMYAQQNTKIVPNSYKGNNSNSNSNITWK